MPSGISLVLVILAGMLHAAAQSDTEIYDPFNSDAERLSTAETELPESEENSTGNLYKNRLLNFADEADLSLLPGITLMHILEIRRHKALYGDFRSVYELQTVGGIDTHLLRQWLPLLANSRQQTLPKSGKSYIRTGFYRKSGRQNGYLRRDSLAYLGSPDRLHVKIRITGLRHSEAGLQAEKDAGEAYRQSYVSAWWHFRTSGGRLQILAGDQHMSTGQGLMTGSAGFQAGKSVQAARILGRRSVIKPNSSFNENGFLRGLSTVYKPGKHLELTALSGIEYADAGTDSTLAGSRNGNTYYRNQREISRRRNIILFFNSAGIRYQSSQTEAGIGVLSYRSFAKPASVYGKGFYGNAFWNLQTGNALFFGEITADKMLNTSALAGILLAAGKHSDITVLYRNYHPAYSNRYSTAFGELGQAGNETGLFLGLNLKASKRFKIGLYSDMGKHPITANTAAGRKLFMSKSTEAVYELRNQFRLLFSCNQTSRHQNGGHESALKTTEIRNRYWLRFQAETGNKFLKLNCRLEKSYLYSPSEGWFKGLMFYQDLTARLGKAGKVNMRFCRFYSGHYECRSFVMESDMPGRQLIAALSGQGFRFYLSWGQSPMKDLNIWFKFAHLAFTDRQKTGSGTETINSPVNSEFSAQIEWKF